MPSSHALRSDVVEMVDEDDVEFAQRRQPEAEHRGVIYPQRLARPPLMFPIPDVELLAQPWRRSPWLPRGIYRGFRSEAVVQRHFPNESDDFSSHDTEEDIWVAVDSAGREVAITRWGNWSAEMNEPLQQSRDRREAVARAMIDFLDKIDPADDAIEVYFDGEDAEPSGFALYRRVAPEHRAMLDAGTLLTPGMHLAPFRSAGGRPLFAIIDEEWMLNAIVEVAALDSPFKVPHLHGSAVERDPLRWHPFTVYQRAYETQLTVLPPGVHVAPWLTQAGEFYDNGVDLIALDRHSRFVAANDYSSRCKYDIGHAMASLQKAIADDDPIVVTPVGPAGKALQQAYDRVTRWQFKAADEQDEQDEQDKADADD